MERKEKEIICSICGKPFIPKKYDNKKLYCSDDCRKQSRNKRKRDKIKHLFDKYGLLGNNRNLEFLYHTELLDNNPELLQSLLIMQEITKLSGPWTKEKRKEVNKEYLQNNPEKLLKYKKWKLEWQREYRQKKKTN